MVVGQCYKNFRVVRLFLGEQIQVFLGFVELRGATGDQQVRDIEMGGVVIRL